MVRSGVSRELSPGTPLLEPMRENKDDYRNVWTLISLRAVVHSCHDSNEASH